MSSPQATIMIVAWDLDHRLERWRISHTTLDVKKGKKMVDKTSQFPDFHGSGKSGHFEEGRNEA
jgi:hypothetical protein